ncbi:hypothetical protein QTP70_029416 [Hemibagrus guttatus]|uniref:Uncharacterized protein n=1 Tax=Hemibagrus guttatus TaxID=175788 RepID=A0AAE0RF07_9TELE|nr:hypothetical protein QTP70_029416 [Hemibagrus guttatus]
MESSKGQNEIFHIIHSFIVYRLSDLFSGHGEPVRHRASRQDTPWTECQPIAGHTHTLIHSRNHTLRTI